MSSAPSPARRSKQNASPAPTLKWQGPSYPHLPPGRYSAVAIRAQGPEWLRRHQRWSLLVEFRLLAEDVLLACFYNLGTNPDACEITRGGFYFHDWTLANGAPPRKGQAMEPEVFLQSQVFTVDVVDSKAASKDQPKSPEEAYSRVRQVIAVEARP